jgi:hypothetical protein
MATEDTGPAFVDFSVNRLPRSLLRQIAAASYDDRYSERGWYRYDKDGRWS